MQHLEAISAAQNLLQTSIELLDIRSDQLDKKNAGHLMEARSYVQLAHMLQETIAENLHRDEIVHHSGSS